jgi:replication factor A1
MSDGLVNSSDSNNLPPSLDDEREKLITKLGIVKKSLDSKLGSSRILSILQDNPCRLRCKHLIRNITNPRVDPFYAAKHDYIRKGLIDAIINEFGDLVTVRSEDFISFGRLDIGIQFDHMRIVLGYGRKNIAIEIKTGNSVKSDHFFQVDRYLIDVDVLIRIRIPTEDVAVICNTFIREMQIRNLERLIAKADEIMADKPIIVPGEWCIGCSAICDHMNPQNQNNNSNSVSFKDHEDTIRHIDVVIEKTIAELKKLRDQNILSKDHDIFSPADRYNEVDWGISNGNGNGGGIKTSIRKLSMAGMYDLSVKGQIVSMAEPRLVNTKTGTSEVVDAVLSDDSGQIKLSLWDDQIKYVKEGDNVTIDKGYTKEYRGVIGLCVPKSGKITKY